MQTTIYALVSVPRSGGLDGRKEETDNQLVVKDIKRGIQVWVSFISLLLQ